jgi:PRTRC genetic system protein E
MFVELLPLLRNRTVSLSVAVPANGDTIVLTIMPKVTDEKAEEYGSIKEAAVKALSGALTLKAQNAEELDSGLHQALLQYVGSQLTIEGSINEMVKTVKAAEEEAKEATKAAVAAAKKKSSQFTAGSKPSAPATAPTEEKKPEPAAPPSLFDTLQAKDGATPKESTEPMPEAALPIP